MYSELGFDLSYAAANLSPNRTCGRPKKTHCTHRAELESAEYFTTKPGKATGRQVQVPYEVDGQKMTLFGKVVGFRVVAGQPHWVIKYADDNSLEDISIHGLMKFLVLA